MDSDQRLMHALLHYNLLSRVQSCKQVRALLHLKLHGSMHFIAAVKEQANVR